MFPVVVASVWSAFGQQKDNCFIVLQQQLGSRAHIPTKHTSIYFKLVTLVKKLVLIILLFKMTFKGEYIRQNPMLLRTIFIVVSVIVLEIKLGLLIVERYKLLKVLMEECKATQTDLHLKASVG